MNDSVTFTCDFNSAIPTTVTWYYNGNIISNNIVTNDTTSTLSLYDIALADSGTYTCGVENDAGATNASAILQVGKLHILILYHTTRNNALFINHYNYAILFFNLAYLQVNLSVSDRVAVVKYNTILNLTCSATSNIELALYYTWVYNDIYIVQDNRSYIVLEYDSTDSVNQGGIYQCIAATGDAVITGASHSIVIVFAPVITENPQSMSTTNGSDVEFNCTAAGYPAPILEWYRVSSYNVSTIQDVMSSTVELPYSAENNTITVNSTISYSTLTINPVNYNDYGYYICVATFPVDSIVFVYDCCSGDDNTDSAVSINEYDISSATLTGL